VLAPINIVVLLFNDKDIEQLLIGRKTQSGLFDLQVPNG
jgi:hypothetical protein